MTIIWDKGFVRMRGPFCYYDCLTDLVLHGQVSFVAGDDARCGALDLNRAFRFECSLLQKRLSAIQSGYSLPSERGVLARCLLQWPTGLVFTPV